MNSKQRFGKRVKLARENKNLLQGELAALLNVSQSQLSKYESGDSMPRPDKMRKLCEILEVSEVWLRDLRDELEDSELVVSKLGEEPVRYIYRSHAPDTELQSRYDELQRSELSWQRKHLEAERENLELKSALLQKELVSAQLLSQLDLHMKCFEAILSELTEDQKQQLLETRKSVVTNFVTTEKAAAQFDSFHQKLQGTLRTLDGFFQNLQPERA